MTLTNKIILAISALVLFCAGVLFSINISTPALGFINVTTFLRASSTAITVTNTNGAILVGTTSKRHAYSISPINCTAANTTLFIDLGTKGGGTTSLAHAGYPVYASSTEKFAEGTIKPIQNSIGAITGNGTCTVLVNEWIDGN